MNVNTTRSCRTVGWGFLLAATVIEVLLLCTLFNTFAEHWFKLAMVTGTVVLFNAITWFFAIEYKQTLDNVKHKQ